ncbi:MAG: 4-hydroxythreonine-4-phosphate dehydrogenase PdxA [Natronospirillum sp.]
MTRPLAITSGEPAGIGPDICLQLATEQALYPAVVLGDPELFRARASALNLTVQITEWSSGETAQLGAGKLSLLPMPTAEPVIAGELNPANSPYVLSLLERTLSGIQCGELGAMVTGPVQKSVISDAGIAFSGHTEYLQLAAGVDEVVMMLATEGLRVALVTTHIPLQHVPAAITTEKLESVIRILHHGLVTQFGLPAPRILVCGLNPHAGEGGHMGREEIDTLIPVLERLRTTGITLIGPLPADTLFTEKVLSQGDAVLAMYHDQGLPVLKYQGFGAAVNITLGLPYIRTSVDHGTALDLAGTGQANTGSLKTALRYAHQMMTGA